MRYKTIVLELLQQRTQLHEQLRISRKLRPALETYSRELMEGHEAWMETIRQSSPGSDPAQVSSEAMELALRDLEERLPPVSEANETEALSLDRAMAFVRNPTSRK